MSNSTNNPAAGPQYQPETLNPGQDAAGAVSQSGTASATRPAGPQQPRRATIRRATLPGQDATAADSGPIPATAPDLPEIVARLQDTAADFEPPKIAKALQAAQTLPDMLDKAARLASAFEPPKIAKALQAAQTLPDIVAALQKTAEKYSLTGIFAALQKTAEKYSFPGIIADLQKVTTLQDAGILQIKTAAAVCISINATPAGISRQIDYFARLDWGVIVNNKTARILAKIDRFAANISAYFRAELETNPYYFELVAEKEAEQEAAARAIAEKEATAAELAKTRAELELYKAAVNLQEVIKQLPASATAAGPQSGHPGKRPAGGCQSVPAHLSPEITKPYILAIYAGLPADFAPTIEQFAALFGKPIIMPKPIETRPGRAAALLYELHKAGFIRAAKYASIAAYAKCFIYNGKTITADQLRRAKETNKTISKTADFEYIKEIAEKALF